MRKNYLNHATHIGNQPVRVLKWNVAHALEYSSTQSFPTELPRVWSGTASNRASRTTLGHAILNPNP